MNEPPRRTITRRSDEPRLEIGSIISIKEGIVGTVLARYVASGVIGEVHYIVEFDQINRRSEHLESRERLGTSGSHYRVAAIRHQTRLT